MNLVRARLGGSMPNLTVAYLLACMSFFGVAGLNRFYLGKPVTGLIWFFTGGLFFIGTIYDLITMPRQVAEAQQRFQLRAPGPAHRALAPDPVADVEARLLRAAEYHHGRLTVPMAAAALGLSLADAEAQLDRLCKQGHADIEFTDEGVIYYQFPALRLAA